MVHEDEELLDDSFLRLADTTMSEVTKNSRKAPYIDFARNPAILKAGYPAGGVAGY